MFAKVVIGYETQHSEARDALALGRNLARVTGARVVLATVLSVKGEPIGREGYERALADDSTPIFAEALPELEGLDVSTRALRGGSPEHALHDLAEAEGADAIVLGSTHHGTLGRLLHGGGIAERLLRGAPCAIAVAPRDFAADPPEEVRVIAVAFDGSTQSRAALAAARELAVLCGASIRIVGVHALLSVPLADSEPSDEDFGGAVREEILAERIDRAIAELPRELSAEATLIASADPAEALLDATEAEVDLLVMGSRGHGPVRQALLGGTSAKVIRKAWCPVLVVPRAEEEPG